MIRRTIRPVVKKQLRVLGVDPSLTSTGYAYRVNGQVVTGTISAPKGMVGPERLAFARAAMIEIVCNAAPDLVVYEDYAKGIGGGKGKQVGRTFDIGELGGVFKTLFWEEAIPIMLVSPTSLKKAIAGRGDADKAVTINGKKVKDKSKPEMRAALNRTFGVQLLPHQGDEADACGLMLMGEMRFGSHTVAKSVQSTLRLDALNECLIIHPSHSNLISQL